MHDVTGDRRLPTEPPLRAAARVIPFPERPGLPDQATSRATFRLAWLLLPAALGAAAGAYAVRERALTFEIPNGRAIDGSYVAAGGADVAVRFSDRSELGLERGTRVRISDLQVRGARILLEGGELHVSIRAQPPGSWSIEAGPYTLHVAGGQFDVAWNAGTQTLDLRLYTGFVIAGGPVADSWVKVGTGQHLVASANTSTLSLAQGARE